MRLKTGLLLIFLHVSVLAIGLDLYLPSYDAEFDEIEHYSGFSLKYSEEYEQAEWVAYQLTAEEVQGTVDRTDNFQADQNISTGSAVLEDYRGSGYDRGHLAPAADMKWSATAMKESFLMSNMSPQTPEFNREIWKKLEHRVRQWAEENDELYVVTGPVLTDGPYPVIGPNNVAVPRRFYKVILDYREPGIKAIGFILPNEKCGTLLSVFAVTIDQVETVTGIDFYPALPDAEEDTLESTLDLRLWDPDDIYSKVTVGEIRKAENETKPGAQEEAILYWINSNSNVRHNSGCRYYGNTKNGYYTTEKTGRACGLCGG
jgi:endonuclease G, mitochondrial